MRPKLAIFPGSFNPWHEGHEDILKKALMIFDVVYIMQGHHPDKLVVKDKSFMELKDKYGDRVECGFFNGNLPDINFIREVSAIIRGLRDYMDLSYERYIQYVYEDLGLKIPVVCFIADRNLQYVRSSDIRKQNETKT
jgi:pantetheine-phosphate adenylyltransferase